MASLSVPPTARVNKMDAEQPSLASLLASQLGLFTFSLGLSPEEDIIVKKRKINNKKKKKKNANEKRGYGGKEMPRK